MELIATNIVKTRVSTKYNKQKRGIRTSLSLFMNIVSFFIQKLLQMEFQQKLLCGVSKSPCSYQLL